MHAGPTGSPAWTAVSGYVPSASPTGAHTGDTHRITPRYHVVLDSRRYKDVPRDGPLSTWTRPRSPSRVPYAIRSRRSAQGGGQQGKGDLRRLRPLRLRRETMPILVGRPLPVLVNPSDVPTNTLGSTWIAMIRPGSARIGVVRFPGSVFLSSPVRALTRGSRRRPRRCHRVDLDRCRRRCV